MQERERHDGEAEELLQRALLDADDAAAVSLKVDGLSLAAAMTVIFHGRRDLGTIQTYVAHGGRVAGEAISATELLRVPCDLDLSTAQDRDEAQDLYAEQAAALRDAIVAADTVLSVWIEPLTDIAGPVVADRSIELGVQLPAHRLMPLALTAPERGITIVPVCGARTLAEGRPPLGIACAQQDLAQIYPFPDDPERCLEDFAELAAEHARRLADQLSHQEASVQRFLELSEGFPETG
ncbi:MAG: hypothetical protein JWM73_2709 [Solirubrobacterales bacterium]|nr:hypothetical protein [Solirubrobacterales bacterium]